MDNHYTTAVEKKLKDFPENESARMNNRIRDELYSRKASTRKKWLKAFEALNHEYQMSCRFALIRILHARLQPNNLFPALGNTKPTRAFTLDETQNYLAKLEEFAKSAKDYNAQLFYELLKKAWFIDEGEANKYEIALYDKSNPNIAKRKYNADVNSIRDKNKALLKVRITREEAIILCHMLNLTLDEVQFLLQRVFDSGDCMRFNDPYDLIDAFCFITCGSYQDAYDLKVWYDSLDCKLSEGKNELSGNFTETIKQTVIGFERYSFDVSEESFQDWLLEKAPSLGRSSYSARRIYRNIACYIYDIIMGNEFMAEREDDYQRDFLNACSHVEYPSVKRLLFDGDNLSSEKCYNLAFALYKTNDEITNDGEEANHKKAGDRTLNWHEVTTTRSRRLSVSNGPTNSSRNRVQQLLTGEQQVDKADLLYLVWFAYNCLWVNSSERLTNKRRKNRIFDFIDTADALLKEALLPPVYLPHMMEQTMLRSIIYSSEENSSAVVYQYTTAIIREQRNRHTDAEIRAAVEFVHGHPKLTRSECARQLDVNVKDLGKWINTDKLKTDCVNFRLDNLEMSIEECVRECIKKFEKSVTVKSLQKWLTNNEKFIEYCVTYRLDNLEIPLEQCAQKLEIPVQSLRQLLVNNEKFMEYCVNYCRDNPEISVAKCAKKLEISAQTLRIWLAQTTKA